MSALCDEVHTYCIPDCMFSIMSLVPCNNPSILFNYVTDVRALECTWARAREPPKYFRLPVLAYWLRPKSKSIRPFELSNEEKLLNRIPNYYGLTKSVWWRNEL